MNCVHLNTGSVALDQIVITLSFEMLAEFYRRVRGLQLTSAAELTVSMMVNMAWAAPLAAEIACSFGPAIPMATAPVRMLKNTYKTYTTHFIIIILFFTLEVL